jgi:sec-independent protein translocase protein TatB
MFDIGFSEIVVIGVVALIVIGPERLPKTARMLGHLFGRLQRYVNEVKADISREMELDELRRMKREVETAARDIEQSVSTAKNEVTAGVRDVEQQLSSVADAVTETAGAPPAAPAGFPAAAPQRAGAQSDPPRQASLPGFDQQ